MHEGFGQASTPLGSLRSILGRYAFSVAFIREILQNSDDAGALKQILLLDCRNHATISLFHQNLATTQGPALLAYNDAKFNEKDWRALQYAYESSKADDSSKIGKYGVGFRSVFHVTDCPQIISGDTFAMFDPLSDFIGDIGVRKDLSSISAQHPDQLAPFQYFSEFFSPESFDGTVIRCPLRTKLSPISPKVVSPENMSNLFRQFIEEELDISLLFLQNIQHIEIHKIDEDGVLTSLATLSVFRSPIIANNPESQTHTMTTTTTTFANGTPFQKTKTWSVIHCPFSKDEAIKRVSEGFPGDASSILKQHKLSPNVDIAFPLDRTASGGLPGRLFTFLPLPIFTRFPVHIHALFAITESRQNLRNSQEIGVVEGSDDQMLIGWNRLLFSHYIPQAWKHFLEHLVQSQGVIDVLAAWPPKQGSAASGEAVYWQSLPSNLLKAATLSMSSIWPIYTMRKSSPSIVEYRPLHQLITAEPTISLAILDALTSMGLSILRPPEHIYDLIKNTGEFPLLTPKVAHRALTQAQVDAIRLASKEDRVTVLDYLLSTRDVIYIIGLPLISTTNGQIITLSSKSGGSSSKSHTMLNKIEYEIFGACDDDAIPLQSLHYRVADILRTQGPKILNVETLDIHHIVEYLTMYPNRMGLDLLLIRVDQRTIKWLSAFWVWMGTYEKKEDLFTKIRHLYLLPSTQGLRKADKPLFRALREHPNLVQQFSSLGISFLDPDVQDSAHHVIESHRVLKRIIDVHALLDSLPESIPPGAERLPLSACNAILRHLGAYAPASCVQNGPFTEQQMNRLKNLPIFPMSTFPPSNTGVAVEKTSIPNGVSLRCVETPSFLPSLPGRAFIQTNNTLPILEYIDSTAKRVSVMDILSLTVDNFIAQEDYVQAAALEFLCLNRNNVPPIIVETLRNLPFVSVKDKSRRKPIEVVDPDSKLDELYENTPSCLVRAVTVAEKKVVRSLQDLKLMQHVLSLSIVQERIDVISESSSPDAMTTSRLLIALIISSRLDCSGLKVTPQKRWLPTNQGIRGLSECRDPASTPSYLFDGVLATFESKSLTIPSSLKRVLGWDQPLPKEVLIKQLGHVLQDENVNHTSVTFPKVLSIIKELSTRTCNSTDFKDLKAVTSRRKNWVPTTDNQLTETQNAVFVTPILESGFHQILCLDVKMREFLVRMGCTDRPTAEAVIANLNALQSKSVSLNTINTSLNMLRSLPEELDEAQRSQLLVPDKSGLLRPFDKVYFNDIGHHANLISSEATSIAHQLLEETLAIRLRLGRLGLKYDEYSAPYIDMGEDIATTIRNNLKQYTEQQFATEFLANAIDAKATEFSLLVNKFHPPDDENVQALSENMKMFCTAPSLVIHNNSTFSDKDFIGIRRTGVGGKDGERDTIGHFGLGVLTMFHFAEVAILISNAHVLFINPSKEHLPVPDVASLMIPLNRVRKFYPSHVASIDGLFGFDISSDEPYDGTIFILPLRQTKHFESSSDAISRQIYTSAIVESDILESFRKRATNCFLFTEIATIGGLTREISGEQNVLWSFRARRRLEKQEADTGFLATEVTITGMEGAVETRWRIATSHVAESVIPRDILLPLAGHKVRVPATAGLASLLENGVTSHESQSYRFFSTLPLAIETSLPCHVMATFILSSDRRSIRLDEYGSIESKFNTWLLSNILPPLYMFLIQVSLEMEDTKQPWPGQHRSKEDLHSRIVIDSFYSEHLKVSTRPIFQNAYNHEITFSSQQVVLSGEEPPNIERLLSILRPEAVARTSKGIYQLMVKKSNLPTVNPRFVKSAILQATPSIFSQFSLKIVEDCIAYMLQEDEDTTNLQGLPLIPLEDGSFGTIQTRSSVDVECFYVWMPKKSTKLHNFPSGHFVDSGLKTKVRETLLKLDMNVVLLDAATMKGFVAGKFDSPATSNSSASAPSAPYRFEGASLQMSNWIDNFWKLWDEYFRLGLSYDDVADFPLVPTIQPGSYVTLSSCKNAQSLLVGGGSEDFETIRVFLDNLNISVVRTANDGEFPAPLYQIFQDEHYPAFNFENVLKALHGQDPERDDLRGIVGGFDRDVHTTFANWACGDVNQPIPAEYQNIAQQLPIWPSGRNDSAEPELRSASDIYMLPEGLALHVAIPFMNVHVAGHGSLRYLYGPKLDYTQLREHIDLPEELPMANILLYRQFLETWLPRLPVTYTEPIPIPNCNGTIQPSNALYAREALFEAAFGTTSPVFIHPAFQQLEGILYKHGLKTESQLDIIMFAECANALEASQLGLEITDDQIARANALFEAYGFSLPMSIAMSDEDQWPDLDEYQFIPRNMARRRLLRSQQPSVLGLDFPINVSALPRIVSPGDLVREQFEAVAWSQRATFARQPNQRVLLAYPALGRPGVFEVIAHIRFLSALTELCHSQRQVVIHDLEESYRFLDENSSAEESILSTIGNENIFLNVNDPNVDEWRWDKAEELVFEKYDVDQNMRHVRGFLLPFRRLLQAAGALQIYYPEYQSDQTIDSSDKKLLAIRSGFQQLREKNVLTDVKFITDDDDDDDDDDLMGHRSFLAVSSEYFSDTFAGGYGEGREATTDDPVELDVSDHSTESVRIVLDYIYKDERPLVENHDLDLVLDILRLSSYWRTLDLVEHLQREIAIKLLKPRSLRQIRECAEHIHADNLVQACVSYEEKNQTLMARVELG